MKRKEVMRRILRLMRQTEKVELNVTRRASVRFKTRNGFT